MLHFPWTFEYTAPRHGKHLIWIASVCVKWCYILQPLFFILLLLIAVPLTDAKKVHWIISAASNSNIRPFPGITRLCFHFRPSNCVAGRVPESWTAQRLRTNLLVPIARFAIRDRIRASSSPSKIVIISEQDAPYASTLRWHHSMQGQIWRAKLHRFPIISQGA